VTEMKEWVNAINSAMNHIRGKEKRTRDGSLTPAPGLTKKDSLNSKSKTKEEENGGTLPRSGDRLDHVTKSRVKGPQGRRLPRKSNFGRTSGISDSRPEAVDSLVDSDEDVRDIRGGATSLSALEASSVTHPNTKSNSRLGSLSGTGSGDRLDFDLSDGSPSSSSSSPVNTNPDLITNDENSFEHAWFIRMPTPTATNGSTSKGLDSDDVDSTSDYSSMHGSPPSPKSSGSKRASSKTPSSTNSNTSFKSKFQKFICSLL